MKFTVEWSEEDKEFVGLCEEFPDMSWVEPGYDQALIGIKEAIAYVLYDRMTEYPAFVNSLFKEFPLEIYTMLHAGVGISGEAGELLDALKKSWVYNKPLDRDNLKEELGDILFYLQKLASMLDTSIEELCELNRRKLELRYPSGTYTDKDAQERKDKQDGQ